MIDVKTCINVFDVSECQTLQTLVNAAFLLPCLSPYHAIYLPYPMFPETLNFIAFYILWLLENLSVLHFTSYLPTGIAAAIEMPVIYVREDNYSNV